MCEHEARNATANKLTVTVLTMFLIVLPSWELIAKCHAWYGYSWEVPNRRLKGRPLTFTKLASVIWCAANHPTFRRFYPRTFRSRPKAEPWIRSLRVRFRMRFR